MNKLGLSFLSGIMILSLTVGCSKNNTVGTSGKSQNEATATPAATPVTATVKTPEPTVKPTPTPVPTPAPVPTSAAQPSRDLSLVKLNASVLNTLDNKKLGWWIELNKNHQPTTVPKDIKKMIDDHGGVYIGDTTKKVVYLTFDEGYENGYTPKILDTLKANNVKAIFFITGPFLKQNGDLVKRMLDEGHQVGNHSINHPSLPTLDNSGVENELLGLEKQMNEKFGKGFKYMRPPMGEYSARTLEAAKELGYTSVFWSYAYKDYDVNDQKGADYAYNMVMSNLHNGGVYLLHAVSKDNTEALDRIIKDIKAQGYEIKAFDL